MVKVFAWSVVLYGSEMWTLQKEDIQQLEAYNESIVDWAQNKGMVWYGIVGFNVPIDTL